MDVKAGYSIERIADGKILTCRFADVFRPTIDSWSEHLRRELEGWEYPVLRTLLDLRSSRIVSTYALGKARALGQLRPELPGKLAILIRSRVTAQLITAAIRANLTPTRRRFLSADEPEAIKWLLDDSDLLL